MPPKLPHIDELWNFDLVFVYSAPMKTGKVMRRPVVSWNVPSYNEFRRATIERGLVSDNNMDWKYANRVQNTIIFSLYLSAVKNGLINARPETYPGDLPIGHINDIIQGNILDARYLRGGWTTLRRPGKQTILIGHCDNDEKLIDAIKEVLESEPRN